MTMERIDLEAALAGEREGWEVEEVVERDEMFRVLVHYSNGSTGSYGPFRDLVDAEAAARLTIEREAESRERFNELWRRLGMSERMPALPSIERVDIQRQVANWKSLEVVWP